MQRFVKIAVLVAALGVAGVLIGRPWAREADPAVVEAVADLEGQWVDRPAESFELPDLRGKTHRLEDYRGKVVFLNFWATFCEPCRREMPSMEQLARRYADEGLVMLAVSQDSERAPIGQFLDQFLKGRPSAMDILWDPSGDVRNRYGTELLPETYIIDREGRIVARFTNEYDWTREEVRRLLEHLL